MPSGIIGCFTLESIIILSYIQFVLTFSLWRVALQFKLSKINSKINTQLFTNYYSDNARQAKNGNESETKPPRLSRPILKYSIPNKNRSFILRNLEEEQ